MFTMPGGKPKAPGRIWVPNRAYAEYTANADLATVIPQDDTIPQIGEGTEIMTVVLASRYALSRHRIRFQAQYSDNTGSRNGVAALFRDAQADALVASIMGVTPAANYFYPLHLEFEHAPGTFAPITYRIRVGMSSNTMRLNGSSAGRLLGGVSRATLVAEELPAV